MSHDELTIPPRPEPLFHLILDAVESDAGLFVLAAVVDITERKRTEEAARKELQQEIALRMQTEEDLRRLAMELVRSNTELEQFASIASHDLQEPLRKVRAFG